MSEKHTSNILRSKNSLIASVKQNLENKNIVAFLGPPNSGKTVVTTLLNDAIFSSFIAERGDEYEARVIECFEFLRTNTKIMLKGEFPSTTLPNNEGEVVFEIGSKKALGGKAELRIKDISGEDYDALLISGDLPGGERTVNVLRHHKTKSLRYGPLSYIIVSKIYAIMIDCSEYETWKTNDIDYAHLLNSLLDFQKAVGGDKTKITAHIAIILTKADQLPDELTDSIVNHLKQQMPQFIQTLSALHSGTREYFKLSIDLDRDTANNPKENAIKVPWVYSANEYNRLLMWILTNLT